jgi:uncharacterized protein YjbJ (UPF0337 family)
LCPKGNVPVTTLGGETMGLLDKILGRTKKATGDMMGDPALRREGMHQEMAGAADDRAAEHEAMAEEERGSAAEHHVEAEETNPPA